MTEKQAWGNLAWWLNTPTARLIGGPKDGDIIHVPLCVKVKTYPALVTCKLTGVTLSHGYVRLDADTFAYDGLREV